MRKYAPLIALAQIVARGRRAPDVTRRVAAPDLGPLRAIAMPGARIEIAERFIHHLVELGEQLDDLVVGVAVIGEDVVARPVAPRAPGELDVAAAEEVAGGLYLRPILELESDMMHPGGLALDEIHRVVV